MEPREAQPRPSASLPPIAALDLKKEDSDPHRNPSASLISPSFPYSRPTPPYSQPPSTAGSLTSPRAGVASPPDSRRTSNEEAGLPRQSLPSISEALGSGARYQPPPASSISNGPPAATSGSTYFSDTKRYRAGSLSYDTHSAMTAPTITSGVAASAVSTGPSGYISAYEGKLPVLRPQAPSQSPPTRTQTSAAFSSSTQPPLAPHASSAPAFVRPSPMSTMAGHNYPGTVTHATPWHSSALAKSEGQGHDEIVRRHIHNLDVANVEIDAVLKEMEAQSNYICEVSRYLLAQRKQTQHLGPLQTFVPSHADVDTLMVRGRLLTDQMNHLKTVVDTHITARETAIANPLKRPLEPEAHGDGIGYGPDDGKGGEPRKRRGRAAPPGRCHSCNRNETPEWRRGPDGARTLCNACGLHYAKLTRKQQNNGTKPVTSSNLAPANSSSASATKVRDD